MTISKFRESPLQRYLDQNGRFPEVSLLIKPLDASRSEIEIRNFIEYRFASSIVVPVDTFSFTFVTPDAETAFTDYAREGDICLLQANGVTIATGLVDALTIETDPNRGEIVTVEGRDLMGQLEDQSAISLQDQPIYANRISISAGVRRLMENTKLKGPVTQDAPSGQYLLATIPGESKMNALTRFLEPLNCLAWTSPSGDLVVGKPNMAQAPSGALYVSRSQRISNVYSMKAHMAATQIPNVVLPIWTGLESVQARISPQRRMLNVAPGPKRLREAGLIVPKAVVVSTPQGADPQNLGEINRFVAAGSSNILQAYAKREIARANFAELQVQANVPGHHNDELVAFAIDQVYKVEYDRAGINENMYAYAVEYSGGLSGPQTSIFLCRLGTLVADVRFTQAQLARSR